MNDENTPNSQVRGLAGVYLESIDVIDEVTVQFNHAQWPGPVIYDLITFAPIADADTIAELGAMEEVNGSGPFKFDFDEWEPGAKWVAVPHENGYLTPYLDAIEYRKIADEDTIVLALESEELDMAVIPLAQFNRMSELEHLTTDVGPAFGYWVVGPTQTALGGGHPANDDPRFRLALHKAIDRQRLYEDVYREIGTKVSQMWLPSSPAYDPAYDNDPFDPEGARELVEASGWDGVEMDLFVSTNVPDNAVAEIIQANLKEVGINVTIVRQEIAEWADYFLTGTFPGL